MSEITKIPIFIGCNNPDVIKAFDEYLSSNQLLSDKLSNSSEKFELAVISPSIQEKLTMNYAMSLFDIEKQKQIREVQSNEAERSKARETAILLKNILTEHLGEFKTFNKQVAKEAIETLKKRKISNRELDNLIEFVSIHNLIQPIDFNEKPFKRQFQFTLTSEDLMKSTELLQNSITSKINELQSQFNLLEQNRIFYEEEYMRENKLIKCNCSTKCDTCDGYQPLPDFDYESESPAETLEQIEKPKKKGTRKKKSLPEDPEEHDSDCTCGAHSDCITETEQHLKDIQLEDKDKQEPIE